MEHTKVLWEVYYHRFNIGIHERMNPCGIPIAEVRYNTTCTSWDIEETIKQESNQLAVANAKYIVKCVNSHEALVGVVSRYITHCGNRGIAYMDIKDQEKLYQDAHNALMLAEEGK